MLTGQDRNCLEGSKDSKSSKSSQVSHFNEAGKVPGNYHKKVQPIPWITQISVIVQNESFSNYLDHHFSGIDTQKNVPEKLSDKLTYL